MNNYLLGLFATDGSLHKYQWKSENKITYTVKLEMKDQQIIEDIGKYFEKSIISRTRTICGKQHTFFAVEINSIKSEDYVNLLKEKNQKLFNYFEKLSNEEQNQFIRGCFDGDGGVCTNGHSKTKFRTYFCANNKDGLDKIYEYWLETNKINYSKYFDKRGAGAYNYSIGTQENVRKMAQLMYSNFDIKLERKYDIFIKNGFLSTEM